jgi:hypothetical protein
MAVDYETIGLHLFKELLQVFNYLQLHHTTFPIYILQNVLVMSDFWTKVFVNVQHI